MRTEPGRRRQDAPRVLIIAADHRERTALERTLPAELQTHSVGGAGETEGLGTEVVVIGGQFPVAELTEVRVHPHLHDKPVVLYAPGRALPALDWHALDVWPVTAAVDAGPTLARYVRGLLTAD